MHKALGWDAVRFHLAAPGDDVSCSEGLTRGEESVHTNVTLIKAIGVKVQLEDALVVPFEVSVYYVRTVLE